MSPVDMNDLLCSILRVRHDIKPDRITLHLTGRFPSAILELLHAAQALVDLKISQKTGGKQS